MIHLEDIYHKGHEIVLCQQGDLYVVDIRADDVDGELIAGYVGSKDDSRATMIKIAKAYIDKIKAEQVLKDWQATGQEELPF